MQCTKKILALSVMILFIVGCDGKKQWDDWSKYSQYYRYLPNHMPQGVCGDVNIESAQESVQTKSIYDQLTTVATFDVLRMDKPLYELVSDMWSYRKGANKATHDQFLKKHLSADKSKLTFYVLSNIREKRYNMLTDKHCPWAISLESPKGESHIPHELKRVELEPEIKAIFGKKMNQYKTVYVVTFDRLSDDGQQLIYPTQPMTLWFRSHEFEQPFTWSLEIGSQQESSEVSLDEVEVQGPEDSESSTQESSLENFKETVLPVLVQDPEFMQSAGVPLASLNQLEEDILNEELDEFSDYQPRIKLEWLNEQVLA